MSHFRFPLTFAFTLVIGSLVRGDEPTALSREAVQFFEAKIRPVLVEHCYRCHSMESGTVRGGLSVEHSEALLAGGSSGPGIVPKDLEASTLWSAINYQDFEMPPKKKLPPQVIEDFRTWILMGAPDPRVATGVKHSSDVTAESIEQAKSFWSFVAPQRAAPPAPGAWGLTVIDRFVEQTWAKHNLTPASDVDAHNLLRRLYNDLVGLPPTAEERQKFLEAYQRDIDKAIRTTVDDLLKRPQFGERWGRHWLDIVRYGESTGREVDATYSQAWRYRDFVIDSFQSDKPYDHFLKQQIAGDLIKVKSDHEWTENLIATGFLALGPKSLSEQNPRQFKADLVDEQIDVTTRALMGISVSCARCHDHKFDPIPQEDYYALAGIFQSTETCFGGLKSLRNRQPSRLIQLPVSDEPTKDRAIIKADLAKLKSELNTAEEMYVEARRAQRSGNNSSRSGLISLGLLDQMIGQTQSRIGAVDENGVPLSLCMGVQDAKQIRPSRLLVRGEIDQPAQEIDRGFVQVISSNAKRLSASSSGRLELADWIASPTNPLTARVMVNRIWLYLMGEAIVRETDNFGMSGPAPTHPELLDHLAIEFMEHHWSVKHMIREITASRAYRLSTETSPQVLEADPDNHFLARGNLRRLDAESIRDSMLAISGQMDWKRPRGSIVSQFGDVQWGPNGPASLPPNTLPILASKEKDLGTILKLLGSVSRGRSDPLQIPVYYRSIYLPIVRNSIPRSLDVFDFAEPTLVVGQREVSNTPDQSLYMLNNAFVLEQSEALARSVLSQSQSRSQTLSIAAFQCWERIFGRPATDQEKLLINKFLKGAGTDRGSDMSQFQALSQFCQSLFCSAEFRYIH
jgi:hypothetical protein